MFKPTADPSSHTNIRNIHVPVMSFVIRIVVDREKKNMMFKASPTHELGVKYLHQFSDSKEGDLDVELKREELTNTLLSLRNSSL